MSKDGPLPERIIIIGSFCAAAALTLSAQAQQADPATADRLERLARQLSTGPLSIEESLPAQPEAPVTPSAPELPTSPEPVRESAGDDASATIDARSAASVPPPATDDAGTQALDVDETAEGLPGTPAGGRYADDQPVQRPAGAVQQTGGDGPATSSSSWLRTIAALGLVIGLILLLRAGISRWSSRSASGYASPRRGAVEVLSRVGVAPRCHVLLLRLGSRIIAVGESPAGLRTLTQFDDNEDIADLLASVSAAEPTSVSGGFARVMGRFNRQYGEVDRIADEGADDHEYATDRASDGVSELRSRLRRFAQGVRS